MSQELHRLRSLLTSARTRYAEAISRTSAALNDPQDVIRDSSSMTAVLLVGLFEALVFKGRTFPVRWAAHSSSAATTISTRRSAAASSTTPSQPSAPAAPIAPFPVPSEQLSPIYQ